MSSFLITRPTTEAEVSARKLEHMGHRAIFAPMLRVEPISFEIPDEKRTIILTSKNGARHGLANIGNKNRSIFAVAEQTAEEARSLGFTNITVGPGAARQLVPILLECGLKQKRAYVHLCGTMVSYNIADVLRDAGLDAVSTVTYQTIPNRIFSPSVQEEIENGAIENVLFYSPRTATIFEEAISENNKHAWLSKLNAYCLSNRVADNLLGPWKTINAAVLPTEKALFSLLS